MKLDKIILFASIGLYLGLIYVDSEFTNTISYPINILVAYLHEFGHAFFADITLGHTQSVQVNPDGSGVTYTCGGNSTLISLGGYLGSFLFANLLIHFGHKDSTCKLTLMILIISMIFSVFVWYSTAFNAIFLLISSVVLLLTSLMNREIIKFFLVFLGFACLMNVIQDYDVGPSSDYDSISFLPTSVLTFGMLVLAVVFSIGNAFLIIKND